MPRTLALAAALVTLSAPLAAQTNASVAARFGTLGIGVEGAVRSGHIGARAGINFFEWTFRYRASSVSFNAKLDFQGKSALLDYYPSKTGKLHLSGGVMTTPVEVTGVGKPNLGGSYIFNGQSYPAATVGVVTADAIWPDMLPYFGLGFGGPGGGDPVALIFDIGVAIGKPTFSMSASGAEGNPQLQQNVEAETAEIQADLDRYAKVYPVLSLGVIVRF
jgi:hypothetical protein